jgi:hypothetical protein
MRHANKTNKQKNTMAAVNSLGYIPKVEDIGTAMAYVDGIVTPTGIANTGSTARNSSSYYVKSGTGGAGATGGNSGTVTVGSGLGGAGTTTGGNSGAVLLVTSAGGVGVTTGGNSGAVAINSGTGGTGITGGSTGALVISTGVGGVGTTTGGSSGAVLLSSGVGGVGGVTGGNGGLTTVGAGNGAAVNGRGGSVRLAPGISTGTSTNGLVLERLFIVLPGTVAADPITGLITLTAAQLLRKYVVQTEAIVAVAITLPTAAQLATVRPDIALGDSFRIFITSPSVLGTTIVSPGADIVLHGTTAIVAAGAFALDFVCTVVAAGVPTEFNVIVTA